MNNNFLSFTLTHAAIYGTIFNFRVSSSLTEGIMFITLFLKKKKKWQSVN